MLNQKARAYSLRIINLKGNQAWIFIGRTDIEVKAPVLWCWSSNTLATWCEEPTHWKRPWCYERLRAGEEGDRGWDGWMASPTQWTQVWANSRRWWRTGKPGVLSPWGHRVHGDTTEQLNSSNHCIHGFRTARAAIPRTLGEPKLFC